MKDTAFRRRNKHDASAFRFCYTKKKKMLSFWLSSASLREIVLYCGNKYGVSVAVCCRTRCLLQCVAVRGVCCSVLQYNDCATHDTYICCTVCVIQSNRTISLSNALYICVISNTITLYNADKQPPFPTSPQPPRRNFCLTAGTRTRRHVMFCTFFCMTHTNNNTLPPLSPLLSASSEEIAFYRGNKHEASWLTHSYEKLESHIRTVMQFRFGGCECE